jgi:hypothetical protein
VTTYPTVVVEALGKLFVEYNRTLAAPKKEQASDYQYCSPTAFAVQIDMVGLSDALLAELSRKRVAEVVEALRGLIFEIDSSVAMYGLLGNLFGGSSFRRRWETVLENRRMGFHRPVALLAVTQEKYDAMLETEFGLAIGATPDPKLVRALTGFDAFFGPDEFLKMLADRGECPYLLFVRASEPTSVLRRPGTPVEQPLLGDSHVRAVIRANAITLNVDTPGGDPRLRVNDTKTYMAPMGLGYEIHSWEDVTGGGFTSFLKSRGISPQRVAGGEQLLRAKPLAAAYGGYGHLTGSLTNKSFREKLKKGMRDRGGYILQPELPVPVALDARHNLQAGYIDRIFMGYNGRPLPLGGFRNYMPVASSEYRAGRIHGNGEAFWGQINLPLS